MDEENSQSFTYIERIEIDNANLKGLVVNNEGEAYNLYTDYGHRIGFSVPKGKNRYLPGTNIIRTKDFYCSKQGFKEFEDVRIQKNITNWEQELDVRNAPSHLGNLNENVDFHALFHKCMQGCESEIELKSTWENDK
ncbi:hypothetical protein J1N35_028350 [Gossypium stocksii]|uniref:FAR1 domain-containing protein n=1 Tax=Gossypium stocksii TaxID=47602 RepID=A0A9D3UW09_9ROSI|nr:hypothetical protein J1N35_028350 [Gossypium stocksii]